MTPREIVRASMQGFFRRAWWLLVILALASGMLLFLPGTKSRGNVAIVVVMWAVVLASAVLRPMYSVSSPKTKALLAKPTRMLIDSNALTVYVDGELRSILKFAEILRAVRVREFWLLAITRNMNYAIPRRILKPEQEAAFERVLKSHRLI
jgi:hypothetical protein